MNSKQSFSLPILTFTVFALALGLAACTEQQGAETNAGVDTAATATTDTAAQGDAMPAGAVVETAQNDSIGTYLTDADGRALYLFLQDEQGSGESTCYDQCAQAWPPFIAEEGSPVARGAAADSLLGTLQRQDGAAQVTYNGWPLYYYAQDQGPGQLTGQDVMGFGAEWYLVTPQGTEAHAE